MTEQENKEITETDAKTGLEKVDLAAIHNIPVQDLAQMILTSKLAPSALDSVEKIIVAMTMGKELGFRELTSLNYIHVIEGKPTLSVHAMSALTKKIGINYKLVEDAVYVYPETISETLLPALDKEGNPKKNDSGKIQYRKPLDRRTSITFYEYWHGQILENTISFLESEAQAQGLLEKNNWTKMFKIMMRARCLAIGCRFVAPQVFAGTYETSEILDARGINYTVDEEGEVIDIEAK